MSGGKSNSSSPQRMRLITWRPVERGGLRGFASVELPIGLRILEIPVFAGRNGPFAVLPRKPLLDSEHRQTSVSGQLLYDTLLEWRSRELADKFSLAVCELIRRADPDALAGDRAA